MSSSDVLRVSKISTMAWCQVKALGLLRGEFEEAETEEMDEGKRCHEVLGFNNTVSYTKKFGEYVIEGTPDFVGRFFVAELKVTRGLYPLNYLLSQAHMQANLYCWLTNRPIYLLFVYNLSEGKVKCFNDKFDRFKALRDLSLMYCMLKGIVEPIPTVKRWKCKSCDYVKCPYRR